MNITRTIAIATLLGVVGLGLVGCGNTKPPGDPAVYDMLDGVSNCSTLYALHNGYTTGAESQKTDEGAAIPAAYAQYAWDRAENMGCPSPQSLGFVR